MERSQLFEPRYSLSTCQFVIVFYQCLPWVLDTNLAENFRFWIYGFCAARAYGPYGWRPYGYVRIRIQITPIWNFNHVELILGLKLELILPNNMIFNLWLLKLSPFVSQNFLTRMQKNKPFFLFLFTVNRSTFWMLIYVNLGLMLARACTAQPAKATAGHFWQNEYCLQQPVFPGGHPSKY